MKSFRYLILFAFFAASPSDLLAQITWDNGGFGTRFDTAENWVGDVAPISGSDSVLFDANINNTDAVLRNEFTIGSGESITNVDRFVLRIGNGGHLTLATGGTLDFVSGGQGILAESGPAGQRFTIEAGATARAHQYFNEADFTTEFIADVNGVTTFDISNLLFVRSGDLEVDLTNYDLSNGDTLVLFDYQSINNNQGGYNLKLSDGWQGSLDYAYDLGGGDLGVALTNITAVPEPSSMALLASSVLIYGFYRRRKLKAEATPPE